MKSVHIRDIRPETLESLKRLARCNHRSLQGELCSILENASRRAPPVDADEELDLVTVNTGRSTKWNREEIYGDPAR
jgi:hypothetical protein